MTTCSLSGRHQRFEETYCLHLQGFRVSPPWERHICSRLKRDSDPWCYLGYFPLSLTKLALWLVLISRWQPYGACSIVEVDRRFRGAYFHLPDDGGSTHVRNSVYFFETRRRYVSDSCHHNDSCENLKYHLLPINYFLDFLEKRTSPMPWAMFEPAIPVFELSKTVSCALTYKYLHYVYMFFGALLYLFIY
jgi:hypothetical protein